ncbi:MAG: Holliday junction branch migration protein RuvA [Bdellovibrionota bacterium]|jgi:Holliday junction DNA helicase RuvA
MIGALKGIVSDIESKSILLDVSGVYYEIFCSYKCKASLKIGQETTVVIYTDVKEDSIKLYGFEDKLEKQVFKLLLEVKGIGVKVASDIISQIDKVELLRLIGTSDLARLSKIKGIGKKTCERILLELKDKVAKYAGEFVGTVESGESVTLSDVENVAEKEAILALRGLGFLNSVAAEAIKSAKSSNEGRNIKDTAELVKLALKYV